jgi:hypothetical protein
VCWGKDGGVCDRIGHRSCVRVWYGLLGLELVKVLEYLEVKEEVC